jgi:hypothetical protein
MARVLAVALFATAFPALVGLGTGTARAAECAPYCDYNHYYGPYDFTYVRPGLFGYSRCGASGECSPRLVYSASGIPRGQIVVRFPRARLRR